MGDDCLGKDYREKWVLGRSPGSPTCRVSQRKAQERDWRRCPWGGWERNWHKCLQWRQGAEWAKEKLGDEEMEALGIDRLLERSLAEKEKNWLGGPEVMGGFWGCFIGVEILECSWRLKWGKQLVWLGDRIQMLLQVFHRSARERRNKGQMQAVWEISWLQHNPCADFLNGVQGGHSLCVHGLTCVRACVL